MGAGEPRPGTSGAEVAEILGIHELSVSRLVHRGILHKSVPQQRSGLDRADVERLAHERFALGRDACEGHRYWATTAGAAEILCVTESRVRQLVRRGFLPAVKHEGRWYFRRHQVAVIANARESRKLA